MYSFVLDCFYFRSFWSHFSSNLKYEVIAQWQVWILKDKFRLHLWDALWTALLAALLQRQKKEYGYKSQRPGSDTLRMLRDKNLIIVSGILEFNVLDISEHSCSTRRGENSELPQLSQSCVGFGFAARMLLSFWRLKWFFCYRVWQNVLIHRVRNKGEMSIMLYSVETKCP